MAHPEGGQARASIQLRRHHERLLLQTLRRAGEASTDTLARETKLTNTAAGSIIQTLHEGNLVLFDACRVSGRGGSATIRLNPKGAFGIGVRLDRDSIETVLIDLGGEILARRVHDRILPSPEETLALVRHDIDAVLDVLNANERQRLAGIGVAQPFDLGSWLDELVLCSPGFRAWEEADFAFDLGLETGLPVFSESGGSAAAIAELFYGHGSELDDFIHVFLGPVVACGVALDGDCLRGVSGNAGDIAVMPVPPSRLASAPDLNGKWDILMSRASLNALARHLRYAGETVTTHADLNRFIKAHHPAIEEWVDDCVEALTPALQSALCILDAPVAIIDADVDNGLIDLIVRQLARRLRESTPRNRETPQLVRGSFGSDAGAIGAASLPMFFNFSPRAGDVQCGNIPKEGSANGR